MGMAPISQILAKRGQLREKEKIRRNRLKIKKEN